jgi:DNA-binding MarR family transcriptional regulator
MRTPNMVKRIASASLAASIGGDEDLPSPENGLQNQETVQQFIWDISSINVHLEDIRQFWAEVLGISGPQWMILMALSDLDRGKGVSVKEVSTMLHVDPSFVTTQSKLLEKNGFMRRVPSRDDARVVLMSLSDKASKQIASLAERRDSLKAYILEGIDHREFQALAESITKLKTRLEKATRMLALEA